MKINTRYFGEMEISEDKIITFENGIPGFEEEKNFIVINDDEEDSTFSWLQSLDNVELSFIIINPFEIFKDYDINIPESATEKLKIKDEKDVVVYTIVVAPEDIRKMTTNLSGPIVINIKEKLGKQVILDDPRYTTKHLVFSQDSEMGGK